MGTRPPCRYSLTASKLRSAHGNFIFNVTGRYIKGNKWYSMLTSPNVSSWEGEMVLTPKSRQACALALSFVFHTTVSKQGYSSAPVYDERVGKEPGVPDFIPMAGPRRAIKSPVGKGIRASYRNSSGTHPCFRFNIETDSRKAGEPLAVRFPNR